MRGVDRDLVARVRAGLLASGAEPSPASVAAAVRSAGHVLGDAGLLQLTDVLRAELIGAGPLEPLLADPLVTDILVNGPGHVWVDRGRGVERVRVDVGDEPAIRSLATRMAAAAGRRLDDASPFVDARLPGGVRLHVALPPLVEGGTHISLRVPARRAWGLGDLIERGTIPPAWAEVLTRLVTRRLAFVVTGGTGAGKTTVLGALLGLVPANERLVVVEDCAEVRVEHPHVVRLESRLANVEGRGGVNMVDLVRQALRMRPDRLVVGEVRGAEVRELLAAMNTGHEGGCGTLHANTAPELPARLEALGALAGLDRNAVHAQLPGAFQVVLHVRRRTGQRRLMQIATVQEPTQGRSAGFVRVLPALVADESDVQSPGTVGAGWARLQALCGLQ